MGLTEQGSCKSQCLYLFRLNILYPTESECVSFIDSNTYLKKCFLDITCYGYRVEATLNQYTPQFIYSAVMDQCLGIRSAMARPSRLVRRCRIQSLTWYFPLSRERRSCAECTTPSVLRQCVGHAQLFPLQSTLGLRHCSRSTCLIFLVFCRSLRRLPSLLEGKGAWLPFQGRLVSYHPSLLLRSCSLNSSYSSPWSPVGASANPSTSS